MNALKAPLKFGDEEQIKALKKLNESNTPGVFTVGIEVEGDTYYDIKADSEADAKIQAIEMFKDENSSPTLTAYIVQRTEVTDITPGRKVNL